MSNRKEAYQTILNTLPTLPTATTIAASFVAAATTAIPAIHSATSNIIDKTNSIEWAVSAEKVKEMVQEGGKAGLQYAKDHPYQSAAAVVTIGVVACPGLVVGPALNVVGFGSGGVQAGSVAAATQSAIGNVASGGLFSICQSAAMGGAGCATINTAVQGSACMAAGGSHMTRKYWKRTSKL
ncbi:hypothetical protein L486_08040 [Kwoniella mangroviensis CBS 10435]|uniref:Uncharacterized protein n=1 Tax=Kwoniella mangroviensis CBS 10435 TaxID=1331196 RepID=A0A1B9IGD6_9TREE|nr:hypothetical protein L486_08040 [Kwoniella mangroviensis CBS 10435]